MRLLDPSPLLKSAFLDMARECADAGDQRYALALEDFPAYLRRIEERRRTEPLPDDRVPGTEFWLEDTGLIVACARLRFWLTPELEDEGGHIGYDVRPRQRRHGYGTAILRLTLERAHARGIQPVTITCDDDNIGSIKIIEKNGGKYLSTSLSVESGRPVRRYVTVG